jgi:hypothetical protein
VSGNRTIKGVTVSDEEGLATCAKALKQIVGFAEEKREARDFRFKILFTTPFYCKLTCHRL